MFETTVDKPGPSSNNGVDARPLALSDCLIFLTALLDLCFSSVLLAVTKDSKPFTATFEAESNSEMASR